jgi:D-alanyl-D-alanine carboxypeptidase/D-alanyl-D-alanine-endopeptidase (penicillin-binding protein 4)
MKKLLAVCCFVLSLSLLAAAPPNKSALAARIDKLLDEGPAAQAHWGVLAVDLKDGRVVFARNEHKLFAPASNTKLFTTAAALETLGPKFTFRTTVEAAAPPAEGQVAGDLVLVGRGDPNLSPRVVPYPGRAEYSGAPTIAIDKLADQLFAAGLRSVGGDVVGDDTYFLFERYPDGWTVDDTLWDYGAPVSALTINDNELWLTVEPGDKPGDAAQVKLEPLAGFSIENRIRTVEKGAPRRVQINREPGSRLLELWGDIPMGEPDFHQRLAMDDPAELAARYLRDALIAREVTIRGGVKVRHRRGIDVVEPAPAAPPFVLATLESLPLAEDLKVINKVSQNLHAEMLLRTMGGLEARKAFLLKAGLAPDEFYFLDGSGLSRADVVAPAATVRLLTYMAASENREIWLDTLPVAGTDGSLPNRLKTPCTLGKIQAKTGSYRHTSALSGYMTTSHGHRLVFSIMVNNYNMPARDATGVMDKVLDEICRAK